MTVHPKPVCILRLGSRDITGIGASGGFPSRIAWWAGSTFGI